MPQKYRNVETLVPILQLAFKVEEGPEHSVLTRCTSGLNFYKTRLNLL